MRCPQCHDETPVDAAFCPKCGSRLAIVCVRCRTENAPGHKFCKQCGEPLAPLPERAPGTTMFASPQSYTPKYLAERILTSRSALEGERKEVTILFCDVVESSLLAERLDPEAMHQLMDRVLRLMAEAVHRYEGTVNQFLGDGLMALFGAPLALEEHALRAVLAALMIQETIRAYSGELKSRYDVELRVRLGLNSGLVVVGRIGDDLRMDYTAVGDATNVAARLQSLAEPGTILMSRATHRLVEGYIHSEPLGPVPVKGRREPVPLYRVTGRQRRRSRLEVSVERGLTPLVGRERELALLHGRLARAREGRGQVVGIVGEPGVGKSRLLYELRKSLDDDRFVWLEGNCVAYGQNTPYLPILEILRASFQVEGGDSALQIREKLRQGVYALDSTLAGLVPYLEELLGLPTEDETLTHLPPYLKQWKTFEALRVVMAAESQRRPQVIVIEDLHWLDKTSEDYLAYFVDSLVGMPVLLLTTHRPGYAGHWAAKTYYAQIALDRLTPSEVEGLLGVLLGTDARLEPLKRLLHERTEGNPFFLEESVRMLIESQAVVGAPGAYRPAGPLQTLQVPATVQAVLAARIDRLREAEKQLLYTAAVIGKQVPLALLQAVADQPEEQLQRGLARLQAAEFLYNLGVFPQVHYAFTHALTHEVAYGSLLQERRRSLHARVINAIETVYADRLVEWYDQLAHHVVRGEVWNKAPAYFRRDPVRVYSSLEALPWWHGEHEQAVASNQHDLTIAAEFKNFGFQVVMHFLLGQAYHALGDYPRAIDVLRRNVVSLDDDLQQESFQLPAPASLLSRAWLTWCLAECGEFSEGLEVADDTLQIAEGVGHPCGLIMAHFGLGTLSLQRGVLPRAIAVLERGLTLSRAEHLSPLFPLLAAPLGTAYALDGRLTEAVPLLEEAVERAAAMHFMGTQARRLAWLGETYQLAGQVEDALAYAHRALDLAQAHQEQGHVAWSLWLLGKLHAQQEPPAIDQATSYYRQALALAAERRMFPLLAHGYLDRGLLCTRLGQLAQARTDLAAAVDLLRTMGMERWLPQAQAALAHAGA
jgi:class 3 adenylate cyclase/tetratricopeptide (TPR) repeat protein